MFKNHSGCRHRIYKLRLRPYVHYDGLQALTPDGTVMSLSDRMKQEMARMIGEGCFSLRR